MYVSPKVIASFEAAELLGEAFGNTSEGNGNPPSAQGSIHSVV